MRISRIAVFALGLCASSSVLAQANPDCSGSYRVYFDHSMSQLTAEGKEVVRKAGAELSKCSAAHATIVGNVDASETGKLGLSRAVNVAALIKELGIKPSRLKVTNAGFASPAIPTDQGIREPINRRVEIDWK